MSFFAAQAVWEQTIPAAPGVSKAGAKLVALNLAMRAGDDGRNAYPAVPTIAADTGMGERTVQRALRHLERLALFVVELPATPRMPTTFALGPWYPAWMARHGWGDKVAPQGRHRGTSRGVTVAPKPVLEPVNELARSRPKGVDDIERESVAAEDVARRLFPAKFAATSKPPRRKRSSG